MSIDPDLPVTIQIHSHMLETRYKALRFVAALNSSIGRDLADLSGKVAAKARLDGVLSPLRQLARAWAGAAMLLKDDAFTPLSTGTFRVLRSVTGSSSGPSSGSTQ